MTGIATAAAQKPRELVELWSATAAARLQSERATPGTLTGTELNRLGELVISAASWLTADTDKANQLARNARIMARRQSPEYAAMSFAERVAAEGRAE